MMRMIIIADSRTDRILGEHLQMRFSIQARWVNGAPHLEVTELETGELRMQWRLVRAWPPPGGGCGIGTLTRAPDSAGTLPALIRQLLLVACTEELARPNPAVEVKKNGAWSNRKR